jgi:hypothetical protein
MLRTQPQSTLDFVGFPVWLANYAGTSEIRWDTGKVRSRRGLSAGRIISLPEIGGIHRPSH